MDEKLPRPNAWQRFGHKFASTRLAARLFSVTFHHLDRPVIQLSKGRTSVTSLVTGLPVVTLTTIGAKSGQPRSVPLIGIPDGEKIILIASNWGQKHHPGWYFNLRANPKATILRSGKTRQYVAREIDGAEYDACWDLAVSLYIGYAAYKTRTGGRKIPILVLDPAD